MPWMTYQNWTAQNTRKQVSWESVMPSTGSLSPASGCPMSTPMSVWIIMPPNHVWMPYQPHATNARSSAGNRAPMVPNEARASTA